MSSSGRGRAAERVIFLCSILCFAIILSGLSGIGAALGGQSARAEDQTAGPNFIPPPDDDEDDPFRNVDSLTFELMVSTFYYTTTSEAIEAGGNRLFRNTSGTIQVTKDGQLYTSAEIDSNGFLRFRVPDDGFAEWTLDVETEGFYPRYFSSEPTGSGVRVWDNERDQPRELLAYQNEDGTWAVEYYLRALYVSNQAQPGAPILGKVYRRPELLPTARPEARASLPPRAEENPGGLPHRIGDPGGQRPLIDLPLPETITQAVKEAKENGDDYRDTRTLIFSVGEGEAEDEDDDNPFGSSSTEAGPSEGGLPGLVFTWIHPTGRVDETFIPLSQTTAMANGIIIRASLGKGPLPGFDLERTFPSPFLSGLTPGIHKLTYRLQDPAGNRSNPRTELWRIE